MNNLSLTGTEIERLIKAVIYASCVVFVAIVAITSLWLGTPLATAAWRALSPTVLITSTLFGLFVKSAWKWQPLAKLMRRPLVNGIWFGKITSDYNANPNQSAASVEIPIVFVIRQTYMTLSVQSFTERQEGESRLEALIRNEKTDAARLSYVFELRRPYSSSDGKVTSGAGELKLVADDSELRGRYWTDTPTHGLVTLKRLSTDADGISCYEDAAKKWSTIRAKRQPSVYAP